MLAVEYSITLTMFLMHDMLKIKNSILSWYYYSSLISVFLQVVLIINDVTTTFMVVHVFR